MKDKIKILILDKDVLARQAIARVLQRENNLTIQVGDIQNGEPLIQKVNPEIVIVNIDHTGADGVNILNILRVRYPLLPVIVLTPLNKEGAVAAIYALRQGAVDFITKPEHSSALLFAGNHLRKRLIPVIHVASQLAHRKRWNRYISEYGAQQHFNEIITERSRGSRDWPVKIIVIGACTGGPKALLTILPMLPKDFPVPIVVVQHAPKYYTSELVRSLNRVSRISIEEAYNDAALKPGTIWIAPGGMHCEIQVEGIRRVLKLHRGPRENNARPSIDVLFRSAGRSFGADVLGVLLSGYGSDGLIGARTIREGGGEIIVQDPQTVIAPDLPLAVIKSGIASGYYSADQISHQLVKRVWSRPEIPSKEIPSLPAII